MMLKRSSLNNEEIETNDKELGKEQNEIRKKSHNECEGEQNEKFKTGDTVFVKSKRIKTEARQMYLILNTFFEKKEWWAEIVKLENQLRATSYEAKFSELMKLGTFETVYSSAEKYKHYITS